MPSSSFESSLPKPFVRWAGGKRRLIAEIHELIPYKWTPTFNSYFEPFVGGGAVAFSLSSSEIGLTGKKLRINDINEDLISAYKCIRDEPNALIKELLRLESQTTKRDFEIMRRFKPRSPLQKAVRFIYLNKTCFNGIWRVNAKGEFNVPWGKKKNLKLVDEQNLTTISDFLHGSRITNFHYRKAVASAKKGDLVYFDPPYLPLSRTASFSAYSKEGFNEEEHRALAELIGELTDKGVYVLLSNSDTELTNNIYGKFLNLKTVDLHRTISGRTHGRFKITEIIGSNARRIK